MNSYSLLKGLVTPKNLLGIMVVAMIYCLSALFGNLLSFSPSDASPLWPAAGVGLAALLVGGISLWPGILLGDLAFNQLNHPASANVISEFSWMFLDAVGPTAQAVLGAAYIARHLKRNLEGDFSSIAKSYLIGVLLCCTLSPSFGVAALYFRELMPVSQFGSTWLSWWVGDSIGVMLVTPMFLLLVYNFRRARVGKYSLVLPPLVLGMGVLIFAILWFQNSEKISYQNALRGESDQVLEIFGERLNGAADAFESVKRYISIEDNLNEAKLSSYINQIDDVGISGIAWLPRLSNPVGEKSAFVPGFENTRGRIITRFNEAQKFVPVEEQSEYFPLVYMSSDFLDGKLFGFDPSSNSTQNALLAKARDDAEMVLSGIFSLAVVDFRVFIFFVPVYDDDTTSSFSSVEERRANLKGYVAGIVDPSVLIPLDHSSGDTTPLAYEIFESTNDSPIVKNPAALALMEAGVKVDSQLVEFFGKNFEWAAYVNSAYWVPGSSTESRLFLVAVLIITLLFSLMIGSFISRSRLVQNLVIERTKELSLERAKLGQALDTASVLAWSINLEKRVVNMDDRSYRFLRTNAMQEGGYELDFMRWLNLFICADDHAVFVQKVLGEEWTIDTKGSREIEGRVRRRDGKIRDVIFRFSAQFDSNANAVKILGTAQDVTQHREMLIALQESEEYSRKIIESSQDCIKVHDLDGVILSITNRGMELMAIPDRSEVLQIDWLTFWANDHDRETYSKALEEARNGRTSRFQGSAPTMTGEPRFWDVHISPIFDAEGKIARLLSVSRDITTERDSQLALEALNYSLEDKVSRRTFELAESEKRYRSMFESNPIPMWVFDDDTFRFTAVNRAAIVSYGYSEEEFLQMTVLDIRPDTEREKALNLINTRAVNTINSIDDVIHMRKDGSLLHVSIASHELVVGSRKYRMVLSTDITERLQVNSALKRQEDFTRLILENLGEGVIACDNEGEIILFNKTARQWHGTDPRSIPQKQWSDYYNLFDADGVTPLATEDIPLVRAFNGEQVRKSEMSIRKKGESPRFVLANGEALVTGDGEKIGAVVVMHDITGTKDTQRKLENSAQKLLAANMQIENERAKLVERVQQRTAELTHTNEQLQVAKTEAEAASRAKSSFLAVMSHEIRTPMNGIVGMVDVLAHSNLEAQHASYVKTIKDSAFSLLGIIDDILDFSKIEASRMEMERAQFNLTQVVEGVIDTLSILSKDSNVSLKVFVDPILPSIIWGDPKRLRQVLINLIGNAIKFSSGRQDTPGRVRISIDADNTNPSQFLIRIADNGIGITEAQMPKLFTSFSQAETSTTRVYGGTGLGLAISQRLLELMQGSICVRSEYGHGSEFSIRLPLEAVQGEGTVMKHEAPDLWGLTCVLVNFEDEDFKDLRAYLRNAHANVVKETSLESAAILRGESEGEKVIIVHDTGLKRPTDEELEALIAGYEGVKLFLINSGRRSNPRILRSGLVSMDDIFIRQYEFLHGVAVTAGIASALGVDDSQETLQLEAVRTTSVGEARLQGRLILVAEDDKTNQKVILRQLSMLGYAAEVAGNGAEAWTMWQSGNYACVLSDLHMPIMDGYSLTQKIRAQEAGHARVPILILTANALSGEAEKALALGVDEYLTKPLQLKVLNEALNKWFPKVNAPDDPGIVMESIANTNFSSNLDLSVLIDAIGDDSAVINEVLAEFLVSATKVREELLIAVGKGQSEKVGSLAHQLKGSSRIIGAIKLGDLCAELENAGRSEDSMAVKNYMPIMDAELKEVTAHIRLALAA